MKQFEQPPSSDPSGSEDPYGDPDELRLAESEIVSLPSDYEDHTGSPSPNFPANPSAQRLGAEGESDDDDFYRNHFSLSQSGREFDHDSPLQYEEDEGGMHDDFLLVEPSDLESLSRPYSSLSTHSDQMGHDNPMDFIYPSLVLSYSSADPIQNEDKVPSDGEDIVAGSTTSSPLPSTLVQPDLERRSTSGEHPEVQLEGSKASDISHQSLLHDTTSLPSDVVTAPEDNSLDNESAHGSDLVNHGDPVQMSSESPAPTSSETAVGDGDVPESSSSSNSSGVQPSAEIKTLFDSLYSGPSVQPSGSELVSINPSWSLVNVMAGTIGFLLLLFLTGYLTAEYDNHSFQPAHAVVSNIEHSWGYYPGSNSAHVTLDLFTRQFKQVSRVARSPKFHVRVLNDNKPWSLEEAPSQTRTLFAEPYVSCSSTRCYFVIDSYMRWSHGPSPWLCSDISYYLHIWFANGTRISDTPPEIFTSREGRTTKPHECSWQFKIFGYHPGSSDDVDYLTYWLEQLRQVADTVTERCSSLSTTWTDLGRESLELVIAEIEEMLYQAAFYSQQCAEVLIDTIQQLGNQISKTEGQAKDILMRARENAKKVTNKASQEFQQVVDQIRAQMGSQASQPRSWPFTVFTDHQGQFSASNVLSKADQVFIRAEKMLVNMEESINSWIQSDMVQKTVKKVPMDKIARQADRIALETEAQIKNVAHRVQNTLQQSTDKLKASSTGKRIVQEMDVVKGEAERLWGNLLKQLGGH